MAAFDKILSGFPQMDDVLDFIRLGDNVVWQISELEESSESSRNPLPARQCEMAGMLCTFDSPSMSRFCETSVG